MVSVLFNSLWLGGLYTIMPKRRKSSMRRASRRDEKDMYGSGSQTGGTGDVKPQILTVAGPVAAALDDYTVTKFGVPVPRFGPSYNKSTVMEILSVDFYPHIESLSDTTAHILFLALSTSEIRTTSVTSTLNTFSDDIASPFVLASFLRSQNVASAVGIESIQLPFHVDMTDSNGNGVLVAGDNLYLIQGDTSAPIGSRSVMKIKYRLVNIGIAEYVGILQSQQA